MRNRSRRRSDSTHARAMATESESALFAGTGGLSAESSAELQEEVRRLRDSLSQEKARNQIRDQQQHAALGSFKPDICSYTMTLADEDGLAYKHEILPTANWFKEVDSTEKPETVFSLARTFHVASARDKRLRDEVAQKDRALDEKDRALQEKTTELTNANKLNEEKDERLEKFSKREQELVSEMQAQKATIERFQTEIAKHGYLRDKIDFSLKSSRENTPSEQNEASDGALLSTTTVKHDASASSSAAHRPVAPEDELMKFLSRKPAPTSLDLRRVMPSAAGASAGSSSGRSLPNDIAAALRVQ